ncbi:hypothetical protein [Salegentibacter sp.]|uniref:hypothetical protein n=1 Tax=Salegentibacter sp. TaxID=1903072 RepID=UPI003567FDDE
MRSRVSPGMTAVSNLAKRHPETAKRTYSGSHNEDSRYIRKQSNQDEIPGHARDDGRFKHGQTSP